MKREAHQEVVAIGGHSQEYRDKILADLCSSPLDKSAVSRL